MNAFIGLSLRGERGRGKEGNYSTGEGVPLVLQAFPAPAAVMFEWCIISFRDFMIAYFPADFNRQSAAVL